MLPRDLFVCFIFFLISLPSLVLTNLCSTSPSCNCILTAATNLQILCNTILSPSELPTLDNNTLQASITSLSVGSSIVGTAGPLTSLPTNICLSYPNIAILDLSFNAITGIFNTSELACLGSNLIRINLSNNFINETDQNLFSANRQLQSIDLSHNNLSTMPTIDGEYFLNFTSTITLMNFSYNQIVNADLWPLFVKTQNFMTIDMSHNSITNFTNTVPVYVKQFTETPDPRSFYLNYNQIQRLSDLSIEQYGACSTVGYIITAYFVVGISNLLLTNNPLICDCQSYNLVTFINNGINDFPLINNGSALINRAKCTSPSGAIGQSYLLSNYTLSSSCQNYTLPQISDAFCSVYTNASNSTIAPPTYWPTTTTILTTINIGNGTTAQSGGGGGGGGGGGNVGSNNGGNEESSTNNSASPSWYIILGIVLGSIILLFLMGLGCFLCKDRLLPEKCLSKFRNNIHNLNDSYEPIIRRSEMSTSTGGIDDQDNQMLRFDNDGTSGNGRHYWHDKIHPEQETQTCFQIVRPKPSAAQPRLNRNPQPITNTPPTTNNTVRSSSRRESKRSSTTATTAATNTTNVVKGIPLASVPNKTSTNVSNGDDHQPDTSTSELSVTSIPLTPSKRAKILPPLKSGAYVDLTNNNLLNTSAGASLTNQRQRRLSSSWIHRKHQNFLTPQPGRPQSMSTQKSIGNQDDSSDDEVLSIPTVESSINKSSKPLRTLPLLNITVVSARLDNQN